MDPQLNPNRNAQALKRYFGKDLTNFESLNSRQSEGLKGVQNRQHEAEEKPQYQPPKSNFPDFYKSLLKKKTQDSHKRSMTSELNLSGSVDQKKRMPKERNENLNNEFYPQNRIQDLKIPMGKINKGKPSGYIPSSTRHNKKTSESNTSKELYRPFSRQVLETATDPNERNLKGSLPRVDQPTKQLNQQGAGKDALSKKEVLYIPGNIALKKRVIRTESSVEKERGESRDRTKYHRLKLDMSIDEPLIKTDSRLFTGKKPTYCNYSSYDNLPIPVIWEFLVSNDVLFPLQ